MERQEEEEGEGVLTLLVSLSPFALLLMAGLLVLEEIGREG